jgi:hypothetical protein
MDAATLGLDDRVAAFVMASPPPPPDGIDRAFRGACHGGRRRAAELLRVAGADVDHVPPWSDPTPAAAALEDGPHAISDRLREHGARSASEIGR